MLSRARDAHQEPGLRDYLDTVAGHWKVLVFVSIIAGFATFGYAIFAPVSYQSEAIASLSPEALVVVRSPKILDVVTRETGLVAASNGDQDKARRKLLSSISTNLWQRDTRLYRLVMEQPTEQAAQAVLRKLIQTLIAQSAPNGNERLTLEKRKQTLERSLRELNAALDRRKVTDQELANEAPITVPLIFLAAAGDSITALTAAIEAKSQDLQATELALNGIISQNNILSDPTPIGRVGPSRFFVAAIATTLAVSLVSIFFLSRSLSRQPARPEL
jgi:hypothetical protein